jgi:prophage antirepressor-like protein
MTQRIHGAESAQGKNGGVPTVLPLLLGNADTWIISESGLYCLIMTSRKQQAKRFKKWVTGEVLPSIRKTGAYGQPVPALNDPETLRRLLLEYTAAVETITQDNQRLVGKGGALGAEIGRPAAPCCEIASGRGRSPGSTFP